MQIEDGELFLFESNLVSPIFRQHVVILSMVFRDLLVGVTTSSLSKLIFLFLCRTLFLSELTLPLVVLVSSVRLIDGGGGGWTSSFRDIMK